MYTSAHKHAYTQTDTHSVTVSQPVLNLIAGIAPTGWGVQNPRSPNLLQPNKSTPTLFVPFWGGGSLIWLKQIR